jgi:hypothetical protein
MRLLRHFVPLMALLALAISACTGGDGQAETPTETRPATTGETETEGEATSSETDPKNLSADDFHPSLFDDSSTTIDNEWVPLEPGKRFTWRGWTVEEGERVPHRIVFTVTDLTKSVQGIRALVGWDRDFSGGHLVETELIFLAQDKYGNIWHFGQYSETWEEGEFVGGQAWLAGYLEGARPGIWVKAEPRLGAPPYSQGWAPPPFFWDDHARTAKLDASTCVPVGCYEDVLVVEEFEPGVPGAFQLKYYARGVGNIRVGWRGNDADREVLVLQKVERLSSEALAKTRSEALELDTRATLYGQTPDLEPLPDTATG